MAVNPLPTALNERLNTLANRLRWQCLVQGLSRLLLVAIATAALIIIADTIFTLSGTVRGVLFAGWLLAIGIMAGRLVRRRLRQSGELRDVAAVIEMEYPRLGERLTTAVELAGTDDAASGSPYFVDMLVRDAETRTSKLDLRRAAPASATLLVAGLGLLALALAVMPLVALPDAAAQARRFFTPWHTPVADVPYVLRVTSGSPTVKRGDSTALTALIEPTRPDAVLPSSATALIRTERGTERIAMNVDAGKREVYLTRGPLEGDFDYQIIAGDAGSDWHHVAVIDPVRLDVVRIVLTPPAYARRPGDAPVAYDGLSDLNVLQHSSIAVELGFSRVPGSAWFEWKPDMAGAKPQRINIPLNGMSATLTRPAVSNGEYSLHAEVGGLKSRFRDMPLRVTVDQPPRVERVGGLTAQARTVRPGEKATLDVVAADDVAVGSMRLEVRVNEQSVQSFDIPARGLGTVKAEGRYRLDLSGIAKEGDRVALRLAVTDTRDLPDAGLKPQTTWFPAEGQWTELKLDAMAAPLKEQEIAAQKAAIEERLKAIRARLDQQTLTAQKLKAESALRPILKFESVDQLDELRGNVQDTVEMLDDLARDTAQVDGISALSPALRGIANAEVRPAGASLKSATRDTAQMPRTKNLELAQAGLREAERKIAQLLKANDEIAKQRLDRQKFDDLADDQKDLADKVAASSGAERPALIQKQKEFEERLRQLQRDSEPLRDSLRAMQKQQIDKSADTAQGLEREVRDLTLAMKNVEQRTREDRHAALMQRQQELVRQAEELARRTGAVARTAPLPPLQSNEIQKALDALKNGNLNDAVDQQEKAAFELERLALALEQAVARSRDPREAARQLARLQDELRNSLVDAVKDTPFDQLPRDRRDAFERQQHAIRKAAGRLSIPKAMEPARQGTVDLTGEANDRLGKSDAAGADERMRQATAALSKLADELPTQEKRLAAARVELGQLRQEQDAIAALVEQAARLLERHDPDAAATRQELIKRASELLKRQSQTADRLSKLDLPGHEQRHARTEEMLRLAREDLESGRPQDVGPSQQAARRELERLEQAITGQVPADEQVDRLAKRQKELAEQLQQNAQQPNAKRSRELNQLQRELTGDLQKLTTPEAPATRDDALTLTRKTENATTPDEAASHAAEAARALQRLADQVNGRDSEADKADRLAKKQRDSAAEADRLAKKKETSGDLTRKTRQLQDEARHLRPGNDGQKEKQQALDALTRAQQPAQPEQQAKAHGEAADALQRLADKIRPNEPVKRPPAKADEVPDGVASQQQADEARKLAEAQRRLRDELARANEQMGKQPPPPPTRNPLEDLLREQEEIARTTGDLAKATGDKPEGPALQQAESAARQASGQLKNGQIESARAAGSQSAQKLDQVAQGKADAERRQAARDLAARQERVNRQLGELAGNEQAARMQQAQRQKQLQQQIDDFNQQMQNLGQQLKADQSPAGAKAEEAAMSAERAAESLKQARDENEREQREAARASQDKSADALRDAAAKLREAAGAIPKDPKSDAGDSGNQQASRSVEEAREQMNQARSELQRDQPKPAQEAMQQAAQSLSKAAKSIGKPGNGTPGGNSGTPNDASANGPLDPRLPPNLAEKYAGKRWGDLPGEIRNQIISDMKARYGEEYARYIKLYFEQLAERR